MDFKVGDIIKDSKDGEILKITHIFSDGYFAGVFVRKNDQEFLYREVIRHPNMGNYKLCPQYNTALWRILHGF